MYSIMLNAVHDTKCVACMREYHCLVRLVKHLRKGSCFDLVTNNVPPDPSAWPPLQTQMRLIQRDLRRKIRKLPEMLRPIIRIEGPLQSWAAHLEDS